MRKYGVNLAFDKARATMTRYTDPVKNQLRPTVKTLRGIQNKCNHYKYLIFNGMDKLGKIFGTEARVKLMRLFLFNPETVFELSDLLLRLRISSAPARSELKMLVGIGMLREKNYVKEAKASTRKGKLKLSKNKVTGWTLDQDFEYIDELQSLLINTILIHEEDMVKRLCRSGKVRFVAVSGVFLKEWNSRIDLLIAGDRLKSKVLDMVVKKMEAEIGKEIRFASLEIADFQYRLTMQDKLIRDVFDYPHRILLDKIGLKLGL